MRQLNTLELSSITHPQGGVMATKPDINEVLRYAKGNIMRFIGQFAADLPSEQKEEIEQTVYLRLIKAYAYLDADAGWKSFVFNHCRGGVLDYVKFGKGFEESKWSLQKEEDTGSKSLLKIKTRVTESESSADKDGGETIDDILARSGISESLNEESVKINWALLAHMSVEDELIHAFAKYLLGFSVDDIAGVFGLCRARVSQLIQGFIARFDEPTKSVSDEIWQLQTIYALGLARHFGTPDCDQSLIVGYPVGWGHRKVDLYNDVYFVTDKQRQTTMNFDEPTQ